MIRYYVKSLEEDLATKTLKGNRKVAFQSLGDMVKTRTIRPNTLSFGQKRRLATTVLSDHYQKTYRPQGIIFTTVDKPEYVIPFDLVLVAATEQIIVHYYRIKNKLHLYYNHDLIPGFEQFIFKTFTGLVSAVNSPEHAWEMITEFRTNAGYKPLPKTKYRLVEYNEAIFTKTINIVPVAVYGYRSHTRVAAKRLGLPHYVSAKEFYRLRVAGE